MVPNLLWVSPGPYLGHYGHAVTLVAHTAFHSHLNVLKVHQVCKRQKQKMANIEGIPSKFSLGLFS